VERCSSLLLVTVVDNVHDADLEDRKHCKHIMG
jgi:hypothetical protein